MSNAGVVRYNPKCERYFVDLFWQGNRYRFYKYLGTIPCESESIANRLLSDIRSEIDKGIFNPVRYKKGKPLHLAAYAEKWLEDIKATIATATYHDYKNSINNHIIPAIGSEFLPDLNYQKIRNFQTSIKRSSKGKFNVMGCLRKMLKDAQLSGYISQVPQFPGFKGKEAIVQPRINWIEQEDQWKILEHIPLEDKPIFLFLMVTGCRPSEARAFRWQDIKKDSIVIEVTFGRENELKEVKGKKLRVLPKTEALIQLFEMISRNLTNFVFLNPRTKNTYGRDFADTWRKANQAAGVKTIQLYSATRHSYGCHLLNSGLDKAMVQKLLGHSDPKMTDRYAEWSQSAMKLALDNVVRLPGTVNKLSNVNNAVKNKK